MDFNFPRVDYLLIDLIASCNLNCIHCRASDFDKKSFLDFKLIKKILNEAKKLGVKTITFSGGEPFLRKDIFDLISLAKGLGFIVRVQSNSLLLNDEKVKKLKELGLDYIGTGLDGLEENHDKMRSCKGAFRKVLENLNLFLKYGLKTHIEFTATNFNFLDFEEVMKICEEKGVYDVMTRIVLPAGKGKVFDFSLNKEQYRNFLKKVIEVKNGKINIKTYCQDPISIYLDKEHKKFLLKKYKNKKIIGGCSAGINMLYISPSGLVKPCSFLEVFFGNIKDKSLNEIFSSKERELFLSKQLFRNFNKKCKSCKLKFLCGGCRARAFNFNKDVWSEDPFCFKKKTGKKNLLLKEIKNTAEI